MTVDDNGMCLLDDEDMSYHTNIGEPITIKGVDIGNTVKYAEDYSFNGDIMRIVTKVYEETDKARITYMANHFDIDTSEIWEYVKSKQKPLHIKLDGNPYEAAIDIIDHWCKEHYYSEFVVTLSIEGDCHTEYLSLDWNSSNYWVWDSDWWEGEKEVYLEGFESMMMLKTYGYPTPLEKGAS